MKQVFFVNPEKDKSLIQQALHNNEQPRFRSQFIQLVINEDLLNKLGQIVVASFQEAQELGLASTHKEFPSVLPMKSRANWIARYVS
jgi:hypothetical protein